MRIFPFICAVQCSLACMCTEITYSEYLAMGLFIMQTLYELNQNILHSINQTNSTFTSECIKCILKYKIYMCRGRDVKQPL